jgi:hypothetical protein
MILRPYQSAASDAIFKDWPQNDAMKGVSLCFAYRFKFQEQLGPGWRAQLSAS